jgi:hypothetical protein
MELTGHSLKHGAVPLEHDLVRRKPLRIGEQFAGDRRSAPISHLYVDEI